MSAQILPSLTPKD
jgi:hypothetical protein